MKKIALILAGCGHLDGAEIREAVITLLSIDKNNAESHIFAPNIEQMHVVNHLTGEAKAEKRNVLVEAARIARGQIKDLNELNAKDYDALILPGGYGAAKNFADIAIKGKEANFILPEYKKIITDFIDQKKPIGAICISPAVLTLALRGKIKPTVTIGEENDMISSLGGVHKSCATNDIIIDTEHKIVSCSAYMREDKISAVAEGIEKLVTKVISLA